GIDSDTLNSVVGKLFVKNKKTLAIAESCTGGLIASHVTDVSGSSAYFKLGIVAYSNEAKVKLLNIPKKSIQKYGAVSKEIALLMAEGIKKISHADIALGVTGIAGPQGASRKKPVGLVYIAVIDKKLKLVKKCRFLGSRAEIKLQSSIMALNLLRGLFYAD
ncbi:MAG: nicotinamide-nucleotide amidohydrolase family protein, partial [Candidatus Omnitrophota bacterium]